MFRREEAIDQAALGVDYLRELLNLRLVVPSGMFAGLKPGGRLLQNGLRYH